MTLELDYDHPLAQAIREATKALHLHRIFLTVETIDPFFTTTPTARFEVDSWMAKKFGQHSREVTMRCELTDIKTRVNELEAFIPTEGTNP